MSVSDLWRTEALERRDAIDLALLTGAEASVEEFLRTVPLVHRRLADGQTVHEPAHGVAAVTIIERFVHPVDNEDFERNQLGVKMVILAVEDSHGRIVTPQAPAEVGGALRREVYAAGQYKLAWELGMLGYSIDPGDREGELFRVTGRSAAGPEPYVGGTRARDDSRRPAERNPWEEDPLERYRNLLGMPPYDPTAVERALRDVGEDGWRGKFAEGMAGQRAVEAALLDRDIEAVQRHLWSESTPSTAGTYVNLTDWEALGNVANPKLRRYRGRDSWGKVLTRPGLLLAAPAMVALVAAGIALVFGLGADKGTSAATVADRAQRLVELVGAPASGLDTTASTPEVAVARGKVLRRARLARACLDRLGGGEGEIKSVGGVSCEATKPSWWRNANNAAIFTLVAGLLTALLAALTVAGRFGFQEDPAS